MGIALVAILLGSFRAVEEASCGAFVTSPEVILAFSVTIHTAAPTALSLISPSLSLRKQLQHLLRAVVD
jgi:hypothetical protein